jgi:short subunit dehydrogenase-like uncharacterized protein
LSSVEGMRGGRVRRNGALVRVPSGFRQRTIEFPKGPRSAVTIPWGDVFTAYISTGIPNIEVYMAMPPATIALLRRTRWLSPMLALPPAQWLMKRWVRAHVAGPDDSQRQHSSAEVYGEVHNASGEVRRGSIVGPNGYELTADASVAIARRLLEEPSHSGFFTPSLLMGADFVRTLPGVSVRGPY